MARTSGEGLKVTGANLGTLPYMFAINTGTFRVPSGIWTPVPLTGVNEADTDNMHPASGNVAFTLASGMNGLSLPQANVTVNEAIPGNVPTAGFLVVASSDGNQVIKYTSINAGTKTFQGGTLGTGTLATNGAVKTANQAPIFNTPGLYLAAACVTFPAIAGLSTAWAAAYSQANAASSIAIAQLGVRITSGGSFDFAVGSQMEDVVSANGSTIPSIPVSVPAQPVAVTAGGPPTNDYRVEVFQTTGAGMTISVDGLEAPTLGLALVSAP